MSNSQLDLSAINAQLGATGIDEDYIDPASSTNIKDDDINNLRGIISTGGKGGIVTTQSKITTEEELPEYLNEYKEFLEKKFSKPSEDTTNYSQRAIQEFGSQYSHLSTKDSFESELYIRQASTEYLNNIPEVAILNDVVKGAYTPRNIIMEQVKSKIDPWEVNFDEQVATKTDQFFDESGELNARGKVIYNELIQKYKNMLNGHYAEAQKYANDELRNHNEYKITLSNELKNFKLAGIELPEDMVEHLNHIISSGKSKQWLESKPESAQEQAKKEIMMAIISDPKAWSEIVTMIDKRGIAHGKNKKAQAIFNAN